MSDQTEFEKMKPRLLAIDKKSVRFPDMPADQAIREGDIMGAAGEEDSPKLTVVLNGSTAIADLPCAVAAFRYAQSCLVAAMGEIKEAGKLWALEEPLGYELRDEILAALTFATRNNVKAVVALKKIREGSGAADMIQDLGDLVETGRKYDQELKAINFNTALLVTADDKATSLRKLYSKAFLEKGTQELKDQRDRAFTLMRQIMGEILDAAEYVFRKNKTRLDYYHSSYRSRMRNSSEPTHETAPAEVSA